MQTLNSIELKSYGISFSHKVALNNVSLKLNMTGVTVLMGPRGSGKTALLSSLSGVNDNNPNFNCWGEVYFFGRPLSVEPLSVRPVFVRPLISQLDRTLEDVILSHYKFSGTNAVARLEFIEKQILDSKLEDLLPMLQQRLIDLKPVWYRIVMIFVAAASKPPVLMLDAPMKKLNANEVVLMTRYIRHLSKQQKIIVALDNKDHAHEMADDIVLLTANGVQFHDTSDAFFASPPPTDIVNEFLQTGKISAAITNVSNEPLADITPSIGSYQADVAADDSLPSKSAEHNLTLDYEFLSLDSDEVGKVNYENLDDNNFAWIVRGLLAVCSMPGSYNSLGYDLDILASKGITKLITLTPENIYQAELAAQGLSNVHIPIYDGKMPSMVQMHMLLLKMKELIKRGDVLAVHCEDGCSATGNLIAAWMIKEDKITVKEAIKELRLIDPDLIQNLAQVEFLTDFFNDVSNRSRNI